jgi:hypothetical protein
MTVPAFAKLLPRVIEIKWSRSSPPNYRTYKSQNGLEMDLRRGLHERADNIMDGVGSLVWWRFTFANGLWGFYIGPLPHLRVTPKKPSELIEWIDAAIQASGVTKEQLIELFKIATPK